MKKNIIVIIGPSGIGKTKKSLDLNSIIKGTIINADSSTIYKEITIGTAKIDACHLTKIKHYLINTHNLNEKYSVFNFCIDTLYIINKTWKEKKIPVLVGGSMLYVFFFIELFLKKYKNIIKNNYNFLKILIISEKKNKLKLNLKNRFLNMLKKKFIDESYFLILKRIEYLNFIGYKDNILYLRNKIIFKKLKYMVIRSTLILTKKQTKWLKILKTDIFYFESKKKYVTNNIILLIKMYILGEKK